VSLMAGLSSSKKKRQARYVSKIPSDESAGDVRASPKWRR
jgi:hypothetical protein